MQGRSLISAVVVAGVLLVPGAQAQPRAAQAARSVVLTVGDPVGEKMEYNRKQIVAKPGERIRLQIISIGKLPKVAMAHNWVLLKPGTDGKKFTDAAATAQASGYIPPAMKGQVLAQTDFVGPGERSEVTLTVPKTPGKYLYVCTFPGHFAAGMWGELIVK